MCFVRSLRSVVRYLCVFSIVRFLCVCSSLFMLVRYLFLELYASWRLGFLRSFFLQGVCMCSLFLSLVVSFPACVLYVFRCFVRRSFRYLGR